MSVGDIYRITVRGVVGVDDNENVWHYQVSATAGPTPDEAAALANAWVNSGKTPYLNLISNQYGMVEIKVRGVTDPSQGFDLASTGAGAIAGETSPTQNATLAILKTAKFGRRYRGKTYFPCQNEGSFASGSVVAGHVTNVATFFGSVATLVAVAPIAATFVLGVYSRKFNEFNVYTGHTVSQFAATQGRRKPGIGS